MYLKLTNEQLNLATSYERWQMETKGNVLINNPGFAPANDSDRVIEDKENTLIEIEVYNLREQV